VPANNPSDPAFEQAQSSLHLNPPSTHTSAFTSMAFTLAGITPGPAQEDCKDEFDTSALGGELHNESSFMLPAEGLFSRSFYEESISKALFAVCRPEGSLWLEYVDAEQRTQQCFFKRQAWEVAMEGWQLWQCEWKANSSDISLKYDAGDGLGTRMEKQRRDSPEGRISYLFQLFLRPIAPISAALELLSLSIHVLSMSGFEAWLDLIEQRAKYDPSGAPLSLYVKDMSEATGIIDTFVSSLSSPPDDLTSHSLLAVLGSLSIEDLSCSLHCLPALLSTTERHFDSIFNNGKDVSRVLAAKGLATLVTWGFVGRQEGWKEVGKLGTQGEFRYAEGVREELKSREEWRAKGCGIVLAELGLIENHEFNSLLSECRDIDALLLMLRHGHISSCEDSSLVAAINNCLASFPTHPQLSALIEVLTSQSSLQPVFARSSFPHHLPRYLSNPTLLPSLLPLLSSAEFLHFYPDIDVSSVADHLLIDGKCVPHTIAEYLLRPLKEPVDDMLLQWIGLILGWSRAVGQGVGEVVGRVEGEIRQMRDWLRPEVYERVVDKLDREGDWVLSWAVAVSETEEEHLRRAYLKLCRSKFLTYEKATRIYQKSLYSALLCVLQLLDQAIARAKQGSEALFVDLTNSLLELSESVKEADVISRLLTNPNSEDCWKLLHKHAHLLPSSTYLLSLLQCLHSLAEELITYKVTYGTYEKIEGMSQENRKQLYVFLNITKEAEEAIKGQYVLCKSHLSALHHFLTFLYRLDLSPSALHSSLQAFETQLAHTSLGSFVLPRDLEGYYDMSTALQPLFNSGLFAYMIETEKARMSLRQLVSVRQGQDLCRSAKTRLITYITTLTAQLSTTLVTSLLPYFTLTTDVEAEMRLIRECIRGVEGLEEVAECLEVYRRREYWKSVFSGLVCISHAEVLSDLGIDLQRISFKPKKHTITSYLSATRAALACLAPLQPSPQPILDLLAALAGQNELVSFAVLLTTAELEKLQEAAAGLDSVALNSLSVRDIGLLSDFLKAAKSQTLSQFLVQASGLVTQYTRVIEACISLKESWKALRAVLSTYTASLHRRKIEAILTEVTINVYEDCRVEVGFRSEDRHYIDIPALEELKDREDLYYQIQTRRPVSVQSSFAGLVNSVQQLRKTVERMRSLGVPTERLSLTVQGGDYREVGKRSGELEANLSEWEAALNSLYLSSPSFAFFHTSHFWTLESYLLFHSPQHQAACLHLLHHAGLSHLSPLLSPPTDLLSPIQRLDRLAQHLQKSGPPCLSESPRLDYQPAKGRTIAEKGKVIYIETKAVIAALISVYANVAGRMGRAWQVLWCRKETVWGEVMAFLYRCFVWREAVLFCIVECENLPLEVQSRAKSLFERLCRREGELKFSLAVITKEEHCLLSSYFKTLDSPLVLKLLSSQLIQDPVLLRSIVQQTDPLTLYVCSSLPGDGKTHWIQQQAKALEKELITLHLTGEIDLEEVASTLQAMSPSKALHIRLGPHIHSMEIDYLVASLVLFRTLIAGEKLISLGFSHVYIEAETSFSSPFLELLPSQIVQFSLEDLELTPELCRISTYLQLYDLGQLDSSDLPLAPPSPALTRLLLNKYFVYRQKERLQPVTYRNLVTFAKVLAALLANLEKGLFTRSYMPRLIDDLREFGVKKLAQECEKMRGNILAGMLMTVEEVNTMTLSKIHSIRDNKRYARNSLYEYGNHFLALFLEDGTFVPVYRQVYSVPRYISQLIYLQTGLERRTRSWLPAVLTRLTLRKEIEAGEIDIEDYGQMTSSQLINRMQGLFSTLSAVPTDSQSDYVMTSDNFVKMMLIYLRALSCLPVVIMGETGCGKTYLIQYFVEKILRERLKVVSVHAGVSRRMLEGMLEDEVKEAGTEKRLWVFLDEFNTSDAVGLISEVLCERRTSTLSIPNNVVLVAACNPYRYKPAAFFQEDIGLSRPRPDPQSSKLVHMVNPIPDSLVDYLWDFGVLSPDDTYQYIGAMVGTMRLPERLQRVCVSMLFEAHKHFQGIDGSLVSLRDVGRFRKMVAWFEGSVRVRVDMTGESFKAFFSLHRLPPPWPNVLDVTEISLLLSFCTCYLLRISSRSKREQFLASCLSSAKWLDFEAAREILTGNENDILGRMRIPLGVALNEALRENVCTLFQCVYAGVPVILCGKPGCSKSLSVQILLSSCLGPQSLDSYLCLLPRLQAVSFQGSETCTSAGIEEAFHSATRLKQASKDTVLPVLLFEEIGSAELSPHNPLKVLHSLLEPEKADIAFVGLSNWKLDASKMNRVVYLARPEPREEDLVTTAESLVVGGRVDNREIVRGLARAYVAFKRKMEETVFSDFFGLRDFYHLVRQVTRASSVLPLSDQLGLHRSILAAVKRNFGGYDPAPPLFMSLFASTNYLLSTDLQPLSPLELVLMSLKDTEARNLILISKGDSGMFIVETAVKAALPRFKVFIGSQLADDIDAEDYAKSILKQVISCMEQGVPVLMKSLKGVWSGLYDLFNQNYVSEGGRKYCQVALGHCYCPRRPVHPGFKAVVFLEDEIEDLVKTDAAFLNRFEKQKIALEDVLNARELDQVRSLEDWVKRLLRTDAGEIGLDISAIVPLYSRDWLRLVVKFGEGERHCLREMVKMASEDLLLLASVSVLEEEERQLIREMWVSTHYSSLQALLLAQLSRDAAASPNVLVFVQEGTELPPDLSLRGREVYHRHISAFTSERALTEDLADFYASPAPAYLLTLSLSLHRHHLTWLKCLLDKACAEDEGRGKVVCVLAETRRNASGGRREVWWFKSWEVAAYCPAHLSPLLSLSSKELILRFQPRFPALFPGLLQSAYRLFRIKGNSEALSHVKRVQEQAPRDPCLLQAFQTKVFSLLQSPNWPAKDWKQAICTDLDLVTEARDTTSAVQMYVEREIQRAVSAVLYALESLQAFGSYFYRGEGEELLRSIWIRRFAALRIPENLEIGQMSLEIAPIQLLFPFSLADIRLITDKIPLYSEQSVQVQVQAYRKWTQFREDLGQLGTYEMGDLYIGDFIRLEKGPEMVELAVELHKMASLGVKDLEMRTICYFQHKPLVQTVLTVFTSLRVLQPTLFPSLSELLSLQKSLFSLVSTEIFPPSSEAFCSQIGVWLQTKCLECRPTEALLERTSLQAYSQQLQTLFALLKRGYNCYAFATPRLFEMEFWWRISHYVWTNGLSAGSLVELSKMAQAAPEPCSFLAYPPFRTAVLELIRKKGDLEAQRSFKTSYFHLLLLSHPDVMEEIARDIEETADIRCFSRIIRLIVTLTGLNKPESRLKELETVEEESDSQTYCEKLEEILRTKGLCSRFGVLLGDWIARKVEKKRRAWREREYLERYAEEVEVCYREVRQNAGKYRTVTVLLCLSFLRVFLDNYASQLLANATDSSLQLFDSIVQDPSPLVSTLRLYVLKVLKRKGLLSHQELQNWVAEDRTRQWPLRVDAEAGEQLLAPLGRGQNDMFRVTYHRLGFILQGKGDPDFRPEILRINDSSTKLDFLTAVFAHFSNTSDLPRSALLESPVLSKLLDDHFGRTGTSFFHIVRRNFEGSFLRLRADSSEEERWRTRLVGLFWAVLSAYAAVEGPLTSPFFTPAGTVHPDLSQAHCRFYLSGAESAPLYSELAYTLSHFDMLKSDAWKTWREKWVKGSAYRCSDLCDYVYFVESCGAPMKKGVCPYCKAQIGGVDHKVVKRPGHVNLSDEEAKRFLREAVDRYRASEPAGYMSYGPNRPYLMTVRAISAPCYHLLHFFLNSTLYFLSLTGMASELTIRSLLPTTNVEKYFKETIEADLAALTLPMDREQVAEWVEAVISGLPKVMAFAPLPTSLADRLAFEQYFDQVLVQPRLTYPARSVSDYRAQCIQSKLSGVPVIEEISKDEVKYPYSGLFRMRGAGDWERMSAAFQVRKLGQMYPLLDVYISQKADFDRLKCLYPLVRLTNHLLEKFSHNIARDEAKHRLIGESLLDDPTGLSLLQSFLSLWNDMQPFPLQYQCKTLDFLHLSDQSELCYFLPDNKELGGGMVATAALIHLANTHNKLRSLCCKSEEWDQIPVQRMKEELSFRLDLSSQAFLQAWSHSNPDYGRGCEVLYDYQELETHLSEQLQDPVLLAVDPLRLVQYQFELQNLDSSESSVISELRALIPQKVLTNETGQGLFRTLMSVRDRAGFDFPKELRRIYSSLEYLLSCLKTIQGDLTLSALCSHLDPAKVHPVLSSDLGRLGLEYIVGIYEEVEERYFPYLRSFVRREYVREMDRIAMGEVVKRVEEWSSSEENVSLPVLRQVVLRLISRCLTGEANPSLYLEMYITRPDFWPEDVGEAERLEFAHLLETVPLACSLQLYDGLAEAVKRLVQAGRLGWE